MKKFATFILLLIIICTNAYAESVEQETTPAYDAKIVNVEDGREEIYAKEFFGSDTVECIILPNSVKTIGEYAFRGCENLKKVVMSDNITVIPNRAFASNLNLRSVNMPNNLVSIKQFAFARCSSLENVQFPDGLQEIGKAAFSGCKTFTQVVLPDKIAVISADAFFENISLKTLCLPRELKNIDRQAFALCNNLKEVFIPDKTEKIQEYAFSQCSSLERVYVPQSINYIDKTAFKFSAPTIYGYTGSYAEKYAIEQGLEFVEVTESMYEKEREEFSSATPESSTVSKNKKIVVTNDTSEINLEVDGENVNFPDAKPFVDENDRTQVPVRAVAETLGFDVSYNDGEVTIENNERKITLHIGKNDMIVDFGYGIECTAMDTTARIVNDRTYVPVRFVAEMLGYTVEYQKN